MMHLQNSMNIKIENSSQTINVMDKALGFNGEDDLNPVARLTHLIKIKQSLYNLDSY